MTDIVINRINDVFVKVQCDPDIAHELNNHFSFEAPGARFHPKYRAKVWDGKIRLYHLLTQTIYVGLTDYVKHFAEVNQYSVEDNTNLTKDTLSLDDCNKFIGALKLSLPNNDAIRDYQLESVYRGITEGRRLFLSPTGSGKSLIIYSLIRWHLLNKRRQLIIVPTTSLCLQLKSDFESYSKNNGWKCDEMTDIIMASYTKTPNKQRVKVTYEDGSVKMFTTTQQVKTTTGNKLAKDLQLTDIIE
jgi:ATP-dependent helicase YprA (DUF1998 family)